MTKIRCGSIGCKYNGDEFCEKEEINQTDIIRKGEHFHRCENYEDSEDYLRIQEMIREMLQ